MAVDETNNSDHEETRHEQDEQDDVNIDKEGNSVEQESNKRKRKRKRKKKSSNDAENASATGETLGDSLANNQDKLNSLEHTVYVEGIPFTCTEDDVKEFFLSNGCEDVLQLRLPT